MHKGCRPGKGPKCPFALVSGFWPDFHQLAFGVADHCVYRCEQNAWKLSTWPIWSPSATKRGRTAVSHRRGSRSQSRQGAAISVVATPLLHVTEVLRAGSQFEMGRFFRGQGTADAREVARHQLREAVQAEPSDIQRLVVVDACRA